MQNGRLREGTTRVHFGWDINEILTISKLSFMQHLKAFEAETNKQITAFSLEGFIKRSLASKSMATLTP